MSDTGVLQTLIVGHLWQSVVLAAVLAAVLILGDGSGGLLSLVRGGVRAGFGAASHCQDQQ